MWWLITAFWLLTYVIEQVLQRYDVSFFILFIFFTVFLYGIIRQLHIYLLIWTQGWIVICVDFWWRSHISFTIKIAPSIRWINQDPHTYVELPLIEEQRSFYQFLDNEGKATHFFTLIGLEVCLVMCLEDGYLIFWATAYSILWTHYFTKLIEVLENVDANSSIEASRFQQPQILLFMTTLRYFKLHLNFLMKLQLYFYQFFVYKLEIIFFWLTHWNDLIKHLVNSVK